MSAMLHVRMDDKLKAEGLATLDAIGLTAADAVRLLFRRIVADQAFPLELKAPNAETRAAMEEADEMMRSGRLHPTDAESMFVELDKASGR